MKKLLSLTLGIIMILSLSSNAFAASPMTVNTLFETSSFTSEITSAEREEAAEVGLEILDKITDSTALQELVDNGVIEYSDRGELPDFVMVYKTIETEDMQNEGFVGIQAAAAGISISKTDYYDGQYFEDYDRYVIDGPSEFTQTLGIIMILSLSSNAFAASPKPIHEPIPRTGIRV